MLTLKIRPNDEITLKENLQDYAYKLINRHKGLRRRLKIDKLCKDPQYVLDCKEMLLFAGKRVVVTFTTTKHRIDDKSTLLGSFDYITVMDRTGQVFECPIEFIDKAHCLKRDHKRMSLLNKKLIC